MTSITNNVIVDIIIWLLIGIILSAILLYLKSRKPKGGEVPRECDSTVYDLVPIDEVPTHFVGERNTTHLNPHQQVATHKFEQPYFDAEGLDKADKPGIGGEIFKIKLSEPWSGNTNVVEGGESELEITHTYNGVENVIQSVLEHKQKEIEKAKEEVESKLDADELDFLKNFGKPSNKE